MWRLADQHRRASSIGTGATLNKKKMNHLKIYFDGTYPLMLNVK